jgi:predicted secreted protein
MSDLPDQLSLHVGEERVLELPSLMTAGYMWQEQPYQPGTVDVSWSRGMPAGSPPMPVGLSAPEKVTIRAVAPGTVTLTFNQRRHWEKDRPPARSHSVVVSVSP